MIQENYNSFCPYSPTMPTLEGLEEAGLEKIPDLTIAKMRFQLSLDPETAKELKINQTEVNSSSQSH